MSVPDQSGAAAITRERLRQITEEGWTPDHDDDQHRRGELLSAGITYAIYAWWQVDEHCGWTEEMALEIALENWWPFCVTWWKPEPGRGNYGGARRNLAKAGALIAAEIDRIDRFQHVAAPGSEPTVTLTRRQAEAARDYVMGDSTEHVQDLMDALDEQLGAR